MGEITSFDYFNAFEKQSCYAEELVMNLFSALEKGELGSCSLMRALHVVENDADAINHSIQDHLLRDFTVPLEREGMVEFAHSLDDVCDAIEQIAIDAYIRNIAPSDGVFFQEIAGLIIFLKEGTTNLRSAVRILRLFDKESSKIEQFCIEAQSCESRADDAYIESVRLLYENDELDDRVRRVWHELFDAVENATDAVEEASKKLESVVTGSV